MHIRLHPDAVKLADMHDTRMILFNLSGAQVYESQDVVLEQSIAFVRLQLWNLGVGASLEPER